MHELDEILQHHGVKGMKWGVRKKGDYVGNKKLRKERRSLEKTNIKENSKKHGLAKKINEAYAFAQKHGLNADDGGGGSRKAGWEYNKKWNEIYTLENKISRVSAKQTTDKLISKYGSERIDSLNKSDIRRAKVTLNTMGAVVTAIPLATVAGIIYKDLKK